MSLDFLKNINTVYLNLGVLTILVILTIICICLMVKFSKLQRKYKEFMSKLGSGTNVEQVLKEYLEKVEKVSMKNNEVINYLDGIDLRLKGCIQKVGIVRYNAYKDSGSNLSFALALLDSKDNGVVINGIYSREVSNTYAKQIQGGTSNYTLSDEEEEAIRKAMGL